MCVPEWITCYMLLFLLMWLVGALSRTKKQLEHLDLNLCVDFMQTAQ